MIPHSRRRVSLADYEQGDLIDDQDKVRMLIDPTSSYAKAAAAAMGRSMDDVIITAFNADAALELLEDQQLLFHLRKTATANQTDGLTIAKLLQASKSRL